MYKVYISCMQDEITTMVRIPVTRLEEDIRKKHAIALNLLSVSLEKDAVVLRFGSPSASAPALVGREESLHAPSSRNATENPLAGTRPITTSGSRVIELAPRIRRRRASKRNRMRTRGWNIVIKMTNSRGQTVAIYEPFVEALRGKTMSRRQMENAVATVLKENGNRPGPVSIEYYLSNTLEYLAKEGNG